MEPKNRAAYRATYMPMLITVGLSMGKQLQAARRHVSCCCWISMNAPHPIRDAHARWQACMRQGDFAAAWRISELSLTTFADQRLVQLPLERQIIWDGSPLDGRRVLVRCHHGLGDTIQFVRYMPLVKAIARRVTICAQPSLIPLLATTEGIDDIFPMDDGMPDVDYDVEIEIMELPFCFRTTLETLPARVPYFRVPAWDRKHDGRLAVGLVWKAGGWDPRRTIPFPLLAPLAEVEGVALHILQRNPHAAGWRPGFGILSVTPTTLQDARLMQSMDLLISVDTMAAHLAGALAVPIWTLLPASADWRWMTDRDDCPWYPTMRLFRQSVAGQWEDVIERVASALCELASARIGDEYTARRPRRGLLV